MIKIFINSDGLVEKKGILYVWNDKNLKSRELEINVRNELGVQQQLVNKKENNKFYEVTSRVK